MENQKEIKKIAALLVLPHLRVQNVNIISSPLTWGFPAVTAILGFVHALERKFKARDIDLNFFGTAIVSHKFEPQVYSQPYRDHLFCLTRNPLRKKGGDFAPPPTIMEGRGHMEISLVIQLSGEACCGNQEALDLLAKEIEVTAESLRIAGGTILPSAFKKNLSRDNKHKSNKKVEIIRWPKGDSEKREKKSKEILRSLLPGFVLINREDLLSKRTEKLQEKDPNATTLDAFLEFSSVYYEPDSNDLDSEKSEWSIQSSPGWIVPIPVGFRAISKRYDPGEVKNARDTESPFCFAESIYSLGEWVSPHRFNRIEDLFWSYGQDDDKINKGIYRCINKPNHYLGNQPSSTPITTPSPISSNIEENQS